MSSTTRLVRRIAAPRATVYRALIDANDVATWMVPDGMRSQVHTFEPRVGGAFRISLTYDAPTNAGKSSAQTDTVHGQFVELVLDERVVETLEFESANPAMQGRQTVTIALSDAPGGGTEVVAEHANLPDGIPPADNELGWSLSLGKLAKLAEARR